MNIIKQLKADEVIPAIVDGETVYRANLERMVICDVATKSINAIRNDFAKDYYVYFIVEEAEND